MHHLPLPVCRPPELVAHGEQEPTIGQLYALAEAMARCARLSAMPNKPRMTTPNPMVRDIEQLLDDYRAWLKDRTVLREISDQWLEITTPYLDRHNDALQIYARRENGGYVLSDDSYTIHDLEASGCALRTGKRQKLLKMTLTGFGVKLEHDALQVQATPETFALRKHNLIQAMLAVNDLFFLAQPIVEAMAKDSVPVP